MCHTFLKPSLISRVQLLIDQSIQEKKFNFHDIVRGIAMTYSNGYWLLCSRKENPSRDSRCSSASNQLAAARCLYKSLLSVTEFAKSCIINSKRVSLFSGCKLCLRRSRNFRLMPKAAESETSHIKITSGYFSLRY